MSYEVQLPAMPKGRVEFASKGLGGQGLLGCILEHDGEYIQCVCDNWPFPKFAFSRAFADTPMKDHPAAIWRVINAPSNDEARVAVDALFSGTELVTLPLVTA